jgi:hypothetical protein
MDQLLHIFTFLKAHPKLTICLSPALPSVDYIDYQMNKEDFAELYRDVDQLLPHRMPLPRGRSVVVTAYVDASHGAKKVTRTSHKGYVLFINRAPVVWCMVQKTT